MLVLMTLEACSDSYSEYCKTIFYTKAKKASTLRGYTEGLIPKVYIPVSAD